MVDAAYTYSFTSKSRNEYIFTIGALYFSWLLLPLIFLFGYYIQVLGSVSTGNQELPKLQSTWTTLSNGIKGIVIGFTYTGFLLAAPLFSFAYISNRIFLSRGAEPIHIINGFGFAAVVFTSLFVLLLPLVLCLYGRSENFHAAYDIQTLFTLITSGEVIKAILNIITLTTVVLILISSITIITQGIALILLPFVLFWYMMSSAFFYGKAVENALNTPDMTNQENSDSESSSKIPV